jgi:hypothetical protein
MGGLLFAFRSLWVVLHHIDGLKWSTDIEIVVLAFLLVVIHGSFAILQVCVYSNICSYT